MLIVRLFSQGCGGFARFARRVTAPLPALTVACCLAACTSKPPPTPEPAPPPKKPPPVAVTPAAVSPLLEPLRQMVSLQDRLDRVTAPLLLKNPDLCKAQARNLLGFTAKNKHSYSEEYAEVAQTEFGFDARLRVMNVLSGSGAASAGLRRGDVLIAAENKAMPLGPNAQRQAATILGPLVAKSTSVQLDILRNNKEIAITIPLTRACGFLVELGNADTINTYSDGQRILVTRGMLKFAQTDDELATLIAKEMAHSVLSHTAKQRLAGTTSGIIDNLTRVHPDISLLLGNGGLRAMPPESDIAADQLSLYMLARAGYRYDNAAEFWQRLAAQVPASVLNGHTALHPGTAARVAAMNKTVPLIKAKIAGKKALLP